MNPSPDNSSPSGSTYHLNRHAMLEALALAAERFLASAHWHQHMDEVLGCMANAAGACRAYMFRCVGDLISLRHEWVRPRVNSMLNCGLFPQAPAYVGPFSEWNRKLAAGQTIRARFEDFTPEQAAALGCSEVKSLVQAPVFVHGQWWGLLGYDDCVGQRAWSDDEVRILQTFARMLGVAVERNQAQVELEELVAQRTAELQAANRRLTASEENYRTLAESCEEGVFILDCQGRFKFTNAYGSLRIGLNPEQVIGHDQAEFFSPEVAERHRQFIRTVLETGRAQIFEEFQDRCPGPTWISTHMVPLRGPDGQVHSILGVSRDVTELKLSAEALRESELRYRDLFEHLPVGLFRSTPDGRILVVNPTLVEALGYASPEELIQLGVAQLYAEPGRREALLAQLRRDRVVRGFECRVRRHDGSIGVFRMNARGVLSPEGELVEIEGVLEDVTLLRRVQAERTRLVRAIENAGEGIAVWDSGERLIYANPALADILGVAQPADLHGLTWPEILSSERRVQLPGTLEQLREGGWQGMLDGCRRDGQHVSLAVTLAVAEDPDLGQLVVGNIRDRSPEESYLARIQSLTRDARGELEAERGRISRELHDELGQSLTAINMNLAWCQSRVEGEPRRRVEEAQQLINQAIEATRALSTRLRPPILDHQGLPEAIRSHVGDFKRRSGLAVRVVITPVDLAVGDPLATVVFRIIQEALTNVARHARATACQVMLRLVGEELEVRVTDNGGGSVPDRLEGVQSLGITGMKERAAALGGSLRVENRLRGGVRVTARLPWTKPVKSEHP